MRFYNAAENAAWGGTGYPIATAMPKDAAQLTLKIAAEACNIAYGITFFDLQGNMLPKPIPGHNKYLIDDVEYDVHPNYGLIFLDMKSDNFATMARDIAQEIQSCITAIRSAGHKPILTSAEGGTTQYFIVNSDSNKTRVEKTIQVVVSAAINHETLRQIPHGIGFTWNIIHGMSEMGGISNGTAASVNSNLMKLLSLSSIVVDLVGYIDLPDGYKSPDYPYYYDFVSYKKGLLSPNRIIFNPYIGLHLEILKHYDLTMANPFLKGIAAEGPASRAGTIIATQLAADRKIKVVKWEWLTPYSISKNSPIGFVAQIEKGLFETDPSEDVNPRCFITGAPLFEDIYVFDIYQQTVTEQIDKLDMDKYPGCKIVPDVKLTGKEPMLKAKKRRPKTKKPAAKKKHGDEEDVEDDDDKDKDDKDEDDKDKDEDDKDEDKDKSQRKIMVKPKKKKNVDVAEDKDVDVEDEDVDEDVDKDTPKSGKMVVVPKATLVTIEYVKTYDLPKCVLVSPAYIHLGGSQRPIEAFELLTKTKVMIYRTKIPISMKQVIAESNADPATKAVMYEIHDNATIAPASTGITANKATGIYQNAYSNTTQVSTIMHGTITFALENLTWH
jgi:hypothetical protein